MGMLGKGLGRVLTVPLFDSMLVTQDHDTLSPSHPTATTETIPTETPTEHATLRKYSRRATQIAQPKSLPTATDEHASLLRDVSQGEAFPTVSSLDAGQDRENIVKTSALPHDSTPRVTSLDADDGSMQQQLQELTNLYTHLQRQQTKMPSKINAQDLEISSLKARIKLLEDKDKGSAKLSGDDALIKGRSIEIGEEARVEKSTEQGSNDTEEIVNVLTFMNAVKNLTSEVQAISVPPVAEVSTVGVPTVSRLVPTVSAIFTTASVVTPYSRRLREISTKDKGIEKVVESKTPKKKKLQEQIDVQVAREMEEEMAREDKSNPLSKKEQREFYMSVLRSHSGWKTKHFREEAERFKTKGLRLEPGSAKKIKTLEDVSEEDIKEMMQLVPVEEVYVEALQVKHPIIDWEIHSEGQKDYWKIIRLRGHTAVYQFFMDMLKQFDREDLNQLWTLVKETLSIRQASSDKENELWVELKRLFEPEFEEQPWTHTSPDA
nr:hypothetical protein [Tanacetum cinerariifolium]